MPHSKRTNIFGLNPPPASAPPKKRSRPAPAADTPAPAEESRPSRAVAGRSRALVVPRSEHALSRRNLDPDALKVLYRLHNHGHVAYLVGGGVRDLLLGRTPKDFDVGTDARPSQVRRLFGNSRIIGRRFRLVQVFFRGGKTIEVSTFRSRSEFDRADNGLLADQNTFGTPAEDAWRRDLTINALFYDIADHSIIDYVGGLADLEAKVIRTVGDPDTRFVRDPVRMIRAVRHAVRMGFTIEPRTLQSILRHADLLTDCDPSRLRAEFVRDLSGGAAHETIPMLAETGLLRALLPRLAEYYSPSAPEGPDNRGLLITLMRLAEREWAEAKRPDEALALAVMLLPPLLRMCMSKGPITSRRQEAIVNQMFRENVPELCQGLAFPRRTIETAIQILSAVFAFDYFLTKGFIPKRITSRNSFDPAVRLYAHIERAQGRTPPDLNALTGEPPPDRRPGRRRRPRRRKKKPAETPASPESPTT
jgi:poly(A) polymerase